MKHRLQSANQNAYRKNMLINSSLNQKKSVDQSKVGRPHQQSGIKIVELLNEPYVEEHPYQSNKPSTSH